MGTYSTLSTLACKCYIRLSVFYPRKLIFNIFFVLCRQAILGSAVYGYNVTDIIVMGHYGCGAVGAAFVPAPPPPVDAAMAAIQNFVEPIRELYRTSTR